MTSLIQLYYNLDLLQPVIELLLAIYLFPKIEYLNKRNWDVLTKHPIWNMCLIITVHMVQGKRYFKFNGKIGRMKIDSISLLNVNVMGLNLNFGIRLADGIYNEEKHE